MLSLLTKIKRPAQAAPLYVARPFWRDSSVWYLAAAFLLIGTIFYRSQFRVALENWFIDLRFKLITDFKIVDGITIIGIDEKTIDAMEKDLSTVNYDGKQRAFLSTKNLTRLVASAIKTDAKKIVVQLPNHSFSHSSEDLMDLMTLAQADQRILFGTLEYHREEPNLFELPSPLAHVGSRVFGYQTFRRRSNAIVREIPIKSYLGLEVTPTLPLKIAMDVLPTHSKLPETNFRLNPLPPESFETVSGVDFLNAATNDQTEPYRGKILFVGYIVPRDVPFQTTEMMLVNTPLIGNEQNVDDGENILLLLANATENLIHARWLVEAPIVINAVQTMMMIIITGFFWTHSSVIAVIVTVMSWCMLLFVHSYSMHAFNWYVPVADSFLLSVYVSVLAASRRLRFEIAELAQKEADAESKKEIAKTHSLFLEQFAAWLQMIVSRIKPRFETMSLQLSTNLGPDSPKDTSTLRDILAKAHASVEDFTEYLDAVKQIPKLDIDPRRITRQNILLKDFIDKIFKRFSVKMNEKGITYQLLIPHELTIETNQNLLDSILFNFISNAVKYSPKSSKIIVKYEEHPNRRHSLSVIDQGPGIAPELQERVFEKYYRIRDDRQYQAKGTGLGLFLARYFAQQLGGSVAVKSDGVNGSTFEVTLK